MDTSGNFLKRYKQGCDWNYDHSYCEVVTQGSWCGIMKKLYIIGDCWWRGKSGSRTKQLDLLPIEWIVDRCIRPVISCTTKCNKSPVDIFIVCWCRYRIGILFDSEPVLTSCIWFRIKHSQRIHWHVGQCSEWLLHGDWLFRSRSLSVVVWQDGDPRDTACR